MLKSVTIKVPGTCGELIQTCHEGKECLISLPIDKYTEIKVSYEGERVVSNTLKPKSNLAFQSICDYLNISQNERCKIAINMSTMLETGIGMASSTADVYGIMVAVCLLYETMLSPETFGALCAKIEPSDGIMFKAWTLFDHLNGQVLETYEVHVPMDLFILKSEDQVNTIDLRKAPDYCKKLICKTPQPLASFRAFVQTGYLEMLGKAMTTSIMENEPVLLKPLLSEFIQLSKELGAIGVVGAHSGSILALAFDSRLAKEEEILEQMNQWVQDSPYGLVEKASTTDGGYRLIDFEAFKEKPY